MESYRIQIIKLLSVLFVWSSASFFFGISPEETDMSPLSLPPSLSGSPARQASKMTTCVPLEIMWFCNQRREWRGTCVCWEGGGRGSQGICFRAILKTYLKLETQQMLATLNVDFDHFDRLIQGMSKSYGWYPDTKQVLSNFHRFSILTNYTMWDAYLLYAIIIQKIKHMKEYIRIGQWDMPINMQIIDAQDIKKFVNSIYYSYPSIFDKYLETKLDTM